MIELSHLLDVIDAYTLATSVKEVTLSHRVFGDSKKIAMLRSGSDITLGRFNDAFEWFSANWPEDAVWPKGVSRPVVERAA